MNFKGIILFFVMIKTVFQFVKPLIKIESSFAQFLKGKSTQYLVGHLT